MAGLADNLVKPLTRYMQMSRVDDKVNFSWEIYTFFKTVNAMSTTTCKMHSMSTNKPEIGPVDSDIVNMISGKQ